MAYFCPNLSDSKVKKDFESLKVEVGNNRAYLYWNKYEGDINAIRNHIDTANINAVELPRTTLSFISDIDNTYDTSIPDLQPAAKMDVNNVEQNIASNNPTIWAVEKEYNLSSFRQYKGKLYKVYNPLTKKQREAIEKDILSRYVPANRKGKLTFDYVQSGDINSKEAGLKITGWFKDPTQNILAEFTALQIEANEDIAPVNAPTVQEETPEQSIPEIVVLNDSITEETDPFEFLASLEVDDINSKLRDLILQQKELFPGLKVQVLTNEDIAPENQDSYMFYYDGVITINKDYTENSVSSTIAYYNNMFLHEMVHAFTIEALAKPTTHRQREFKTKMTKLYELAKKHATNKTLYGYEDIFEFTSEIGSNLKFVAELKNKPFNIWQRIVRAIGDLLNISALSEYGGASLYEQSLDALYSYVKTIKKEDTIRASEPRVYKATLKETIREFVNLNQKSETFGKDFFELAKSLSNQFQEESGTRVTHKESLVTLLSVTRLMNEYGYGLDKNPTEEMQKAIDRGQALGNVIHGNFENIVNESPLKTSKEKSGIKTELTSAGREDLNKIIAKFKKPGYTLISEFEVFDPTRGIYGKIDLVVIDNKGKIHLYDFKNKEAGFGKYDTIYKDKSGTLVPSAKQRAQTQLSLYKKMFESMTGLPVSTMNVAMIKPTVKGSEDGTNLQITKVILDNTVEPTGVDSFNTTTADANTMWGKLFKGFNPKSQSVLKDMPGAENERMSLLVEEMLLTHRYDALEVSQVKATIHSIIKKLELQVNSLRRNRKTDQADHLVTVIENLKKQDKNISSMQLIVDQVKKDTHAILNQYKFYKNNGKKIPIKVLQLWKETIEAYNDLGGYASLLKAQLLLLDETDANVKIFNSLLKNLNAVVKEIEVIKTFYVNEGEEQLLDYLEPYFNRIYAEERKRLAKSFGNATVDQKKGLTRDQFIEQGMAEPDMMVQLKHRTRVALKEEFKRASRDISTLGSWVDNLLDSKDPMIAAMTKSWAKVEWDSRQQDKVALDELMASLKELEKYNTNTAFSSYEDVYDFLLEVNEKGEKTGYLITNINSALMDEFRQYSKKLEDQGLSEQARFKKQYQWREKHAPLDSKAYNKAREELIDELIAKGKMTLAEKSNVMAFYKLRQTGNIKNVTLQDLVNSGELNHEAQDIISSWSRNSTWEYRKLRSSYYKKFGSPKYDALKNDMSPEGRAKWTFYQLILKMSKEANGNLPNTNRIGLRLPGVTKDLNERIKSKDWKHTEALKETIKKEFNVQPDDVERDQTYLEDENGNRKYFLPIHYTRSDLDVKTQSFDIPTIFYKFWSMSNDYNNKTNVISEMELAKYFINNRKTTPVNTRKSNLQWWNAKDKKELRENNNNLAAQLDDWFMTCVYGFPKKDQGKIKVGKNAYVDVAKLVDSLNKYTSINLLGLNFIQGTSNALLGEVLQIAEAVAGEYVTIKSYHKGTKYYISNLHLMMGDVGRREKLSTASLLMEQFDTLNDSIGTEFSQNTKIRQLMSSDTLFFTTRAGEHEMQGRFLFAMLSDKRAINKDGKDIGSLLDHYYSENGVLKVNKDVDLKLSKWTTKDQFDFQYKMKGILSRLHGEYSDLGRVALQRGALGRMAYMFRKFVVPGLRRRWAKEEYLERLDDFVEGSYISTGRFFGALMEDLIKMKLSLLSENWSELSDHQKANVRRTLTEVTFLVMALVLANVAIQQIKDIDDDEWEDRMWSFMAYQTVRLKSELLFFINPFETMAILRSPVASMSSAENLITLLSMLMHPLDLNERYERGPWKGKLKIVKPLTNMVPAYRQYYRIRDLREQISWFSDKF